MNTLKTRHIGDGAYVGLDQGGHQIWLGANDHRNMTVALGHDEIRALIEWLFEVVPGSAYAICKPLVDKASR